MTLGFNATEPLLMRFIIQTTKPMAMNQSSAVNTTLLTSTVMKKAPRKEAVGSELQTYFFNSCLYLIRVDAPLAPASCWQLNITRDQNLLCMYSH